jgi:uncharacterized protein YjbI with pentapeptide repeats
MSTQNEKPPSPQTPGASPSRGVLAYVLGGVALGILLGALGLLVYKEHLPKATTGFYNITIITFSVVVVLFILFFAFKKYLIRYLLGEKAANAEHFLDDAQHLSDKLTVLLVDKLMPESAEEERDRAKLILPKLTHWFVWARLRNWWWQWLLGVFLAIGGLTGTLLLMNQNKLLEIQNQLATNQMHLGEASRRSALVFLMSNILDKVDAEIASQKEKNPKDSLFSLTPSLIGQIVALSHSFKPYRYLEDSTLIPRPLSPERGQLLMTLVLLPLDTFTLNQIYFKATFEDAALQRAKLKDAYLVKTTLWKADLWAADLSEAVLTEAILPHARLQWTLLKEVDLSKANLWGVELIYADLEGANLTRAFMQEANLWKANLLETKLIGADLRLADFEDTQITLQQLKEVYTLYQCQNLHDSLRIPLMETHPHLFEEPED